MEKFSLITVYFLVNSLFFWLRRRPVKHYCRTRFDNKIPLMPWAVAPYVSYYLLFGLAPVLLYFSPYFYDYARTMILAQIIASLIWYFFPNGMIRPEINGFGRTRNWVRRLYRLCGDAGCAFPSAHTYHSLIMGLFLSRLFPQYQALVAAWVAMIVVSTVLTKQHFVADVVGGTILSLVTITLG